MAKAASERPVSNAQAKTLMGGLLATEHSDLSCGTSKASWEKAGQTSRLRTAGVFALMRPCGVIASLRELYGTESMSQVVCILMNLREVHGREWEAIGYDDACHLHKFIHNRKRQETYAGNILWEELSRVKCFVDRFHYGNHTDKWCMTNMDPERAEMLPILRRFGPQGEALDKVNTQICEETFSWMKGYKNSTRQMGEARFRWFLLRLCWMRNDAQVCLYACTAWERRRAAL
jgi:hypothetical protein